MAPIDQAAFQGLVAASPFVAKYGATIDRESAHERITGRLATARAAAAEAAMRDKLEPTTAGGLNTMTPAQQQREIAAPGPGDGSGSKGRRTRARSTGSGGARSREGSPAERRQRDPDRRPGRVTSRLGQDIIRGVFGTIFGGGREPLTRR